MKTFRQSELISASRRGDIAEVQKLLNLATERDMEADNGWALAWAAKGGYIDVVKLLLPACDPKISQSRALRLAAESGNTHIVKILIPYSDVDDGFKQMNRLKEYKGADNLSQYISLETLGSIEKETLAFLPNAAMRRAKETALRVKKQLNQNLTETENNSRPIRVRI